MIYRVVRAYLGKVADSDLYLSRATGKPHAGDVKFPSTKDSPKKQEKLLNRKKFTDNLAHQLENLAKKHNVKILEFEPTIGFWKDIDPRRPEIPLMTSEPSMRITIDHSNQEFIDEFRKRFKQNAVLEIMDSPVEGVGMETELTIFLGKDFSFAKPLITKFKIQNATYRRTNKTIVIVYGEDSEGIEKIRMLKGYLERGGIKFSERKVPTVLHR